jgi:hypothetical protein
MNNTGIMRVSKDQLAEMIDETDWARIVAMTEAADPRPLHVQNVRTSDAVLVLNRDCAPLATIGGARS